MKKCPIASNYICSILFKKNLKAGMAKMLNFDRADAGNMKSDMLFLYSSLC